MQLPAGEHGEQLREQIDGLVAKYEMKQKKTTWQQSRREWRKEMKSKQKTVRKELRGKKNEWKTMQRQWKRESKGMQRQWKGEKQKERKQGVKDKSRDWKQRKEGKRQKGSWKKGQGKEKKGDWEGKTRQWKKNQVKAKQGNGWAKKEQSKKQGHRGGIGEMVDKEEDFKHTNGNLEPHADEIEVEDVGEGIDLVPDLEEGSGSVDLEDQRLFDQLEEALRHVEYARKHAPPKTPKITRPFGV